MSSGVKLLFIMLFSSVGMGYVIYGKKQQNFILILIGIALCAYTYFVANVLAILGIGLGLVAIPFFIRG